MPTVKDVAREAGVSPTTVSVVMNGQTREKNISETTYKKVIAAARKLGYSPNLSARRLRSSKDPSVNIGLFWNADTRVHIFSRMVKGMQQVKTTSEIPINITLHPFLNGQLANEKSLFTLTDYNGVIIGTTDHEDMRYLESHPPMVPIVLINRQSEQFNRIMIDNDRAGRYIADTFAAHNAKRAGVVTLSNSYLAMSDRRVGFENRCKELGIQILERDIIAVDDSLAGGANAAHKFLIHKDDLPDAIFCDDDHIAEGLLYVFMQEGIAVPEQVKVFAIGMGNPDRSLFTFPPLSVIDIPYEKMSAEAVRLLLRSISDPGAAVRIVMEPDIYLRASCS